MRTDKPFSILLVLLAASIARTEDTIAGTRESAFADIARPAPRPVGAPRYSDVILSSRWPRPKDAGDPYETFEAARGVHATRIDWLYLTDDNQNYDIGSFVAELKAHGYHATAALNSKLPDAINGATRERGRVLNLNGEPVALPWLPGSWNGDPTSPEWRESWLTHAKVVVDAGVDALQIDDPGWMVSQSQDCHTETCLARALELGVQVGSAAFRRQVTRDFFRTVFDELDAYAGRHVPVSANNFFGQWSWPIPDLQELFDFGMAEINVFDVSGNT